MFDLKDAPELEEVRRHWAMAREGKDDLGRPLSISDRSIAFSHAKAEAYKAARAEERKRMRDVEKMQKEKETAERKKQRAESGELDLSTGPGTAVAKKLDKMSGADLLQEGLKEHKSGKQKSPLFSG